MMGTDDEKGSENFMLSVLLVEDDDIIVYKILELDRNTWHHTIMCQKTLKKQLHEKSKSKCKIDTIP